MERHQRRDDDSLKQQKRKVRGKKMSRKCVSVYILETVVHRWIGSDEANRCRKALVCCYDARRVISYPIFYGI